MCVVLMNNLTEYEGRREIDGARREKGDEKWNIEKRFTHQKYVNSALEIFRSCAIYISLNAGFDPFAKRLFHFAIRALYPIFCCLLKHLSFKVQFILKRFVPFFST